MKRVERIAEKRIWEMLIDERLVECFQIPCKYITAMTRCQSLHLTSRVAHFHSFDLLIISLLRRLPFSDCALYASENILMKTNYQQMTWKLQATFHSQLRMFQCHALNMKLFG